jgi:uncharacterized protein (TIGR03066 family)
MRVRGWVALVALVFGSLAAAGEPKTVEELKKELAGRWESADRDKVPVEFATDGTMKVPMYRDGKWTLINGTYSIDAKGEVRYMAASGGITLGGWYTFKDGVLATAMGPKNRVRFNKVEPKK